MTRTPEPLAWGILGTGVIANRFAEALRGSRYGRLVAIGSRSNEAAEQFRRVHGQHVRAGEYERVLRDEGVDAVYIATPHSLHAEWTKRAFRFGKHVLCEKPLAVSYSEALAVVDAAQNAGVVLMEGFMYRFHPQMRLLTDLVRTGAVGTARRVQITFSFAGRAEPNAARIFDPQLGGGAILDVGCYCTSVARMVAGAAHGHLFGEPIAISAQGHVVDGIDEHASATLRFGDGMLADLWCSCTVPEPNGIEIAGTEGTIVIDRPCWLDGYQTGPCQVKVSTASGHARTIDVTAETSMFSCEADALAKARPRQEVREVPWADSLGNMRVLDSWRRLVGL